MTIDEFTAQVIEGYLFKDLKNMSLIKLGKGEDYGACGYPMVSAILSGIELLGALLNRVTFSPAPGAGNTYFLNYWDNYLAKEKPDYAGRGPMIRKLVRHGLAHQFVTKPGIAVTKNHQRLHLSRFSSPTAGDGLFIDAVRFYKDLERSYNKLVKPVITNNRPFKSVMQQRLDEIEAVYSKESLTYFPQSIQPTTSTFTLVKASGASVSFPPVTSSGIRGLSASTTLPPWDPEPE